MQHAASAGLASAVAVHNGSSSPDSLASLSGSSLFMSTAGALLPLTSAVFQCECCYGDITSSEDKLLQFARWSAPACADVNILALGLGHHCCWGIAIQDGRVGAARPALCAARSAAVPSKTPPTLPLRPSTPKLCRASRLSQPLRHGQTQLAILLLRPKVRHLMHSVLKRSLTGTLEHTFFYDAGNYHCDS